MGLVLLCIVNLLFGRTIQFCKPVIVLSIASYWVYLIHVKILTLEWYVWGYNDVVFPLIVTIALSIFFSKTVKIGKQRCVDFKTFVN